MKTLTTLLLFSACALSAVRSTAATEESLTKAFPVVPGGTLAVDVSFGSIEVFSEPGRTEVGIDVWRKISRKSTAEEEAFLKENPVEFTHDGSTVTIRARGKSTQSWSWFGWSSRSEARYTVRVPEKLTAKLKTDGGSITTTGIAGPVSANTSGGSLHFKRIHGLLDGRTSGGSINADDCEGEINLNTSGGGIHVTGGGGSLRADTSGGGITVKVFNGAAAVGTSGGGITIEDIRGKINGHTSGGSVHAALLSPLPGDVDLSTSGGGVTATVAADTALNLDASSSGGGVTCDLPLTVQGKIQRDRAIGTVNGGGPTVRLHTSGGSVHVKKG